MIPRESKWLSSAVSVIGGIVFVRNVVILGRSCTQRSIGNNVNTFYIKFKLGLHLQKGWYAIFLVVLK